MDFNVLIQWFLKNKRDLPWRKNRSFYRVWISEIMLQQTQVDTVIPYYEKFLESFPDLSSLAEANLDVVLKHWEGLGYYSRARNLHKAAQEIVKAGKIPENYEDLIRYSGFGPYTTSAVLSLVYKKKHPVLDGNVKRVISRIYNIDENIELRSTLKRLQKILEDEIVKFEADNFNESLMELGAMICKPKNPLCKDCPLKKECISFQNGTQLTLPVKAKKKKIPTKHEQSYIALYQNKILIEKRPLNGMLAGLWKLPNQLNNLFYSNEKKLGRIKHQYSHFKLELECIVVNFNSSPKLDENKTFVDIGELTRFAFDKASLKVLEMFKGHYEKTLFD